MRATADRGTASAPVAVVAMILFVLAWPQPHQMRPHPRRSIREIDFVGSFLFIAASVLFVFAFQEGGVTLDAWTSNTVLEPLVVGCLCWVILLMWEYLVSIRWARSIAAILPFRLLRRRVYMAAAGATMLHGFIYFVIIYTLPVRFQIVNGQNALLAGVGLLPLLGSAGIGSFLGGALNKTKNRTAYTLVAASVFALLGVGLLSTLGPTNAPEPKTYGFQVFVGLGFGLAVSTASLMASYEVSFNDAGESYIFIFSFC